MSNVDIVLSDGVNYIERRKLRQLTSSEILKKYWSKKEFLHRLLNRFSNWRFDQYIKNGSIWALYNKARKNKSFAAILQIYLKVQGKYHWKIDSIVWKNTLRWIKAISKNVNEKEYNSILKLEAFKHAIRIWRLRTRKYRVTYANLLYWKKKWYKRIKMYYSGVRYDIVDVDDAIAIYKAMIRSGELSTNIMEEWVKYAHHWKYNRKKAREYAYKHYIKYHSIEAKEKYSLEGLVSFMASLDGLSENNPEDRKILKKLLGFDPKYTSWCAAIVKIALKKVFPGRGYEKKFSLLGWSVLWLESQWYHVWVSDGMGWYRSWNTRWWKVAHERLNWYVGRVYPWDAGDISKVHWWVEWWIPPAGALVVPYAYKSSLRRTHFYKTHYARLNSSYVNRSYSKHKRPDPLDILRV